MGYFDLPSCVGGSADKLDLLLGHYAREQQGQIGLKW
jgi:hypothetical protein